MLDVQGRLNCFNVQVLLEVSGIKDFGFAKSSGYVGRILRLIAQLTSRIFVHEIFTKQARYVKPR